jgi:hypothetical protein
MELTEQVLFLFKFVEGLALQRLFPVIAVENKQPLQFFV